MLLPVTMLVGQFLLSNDDLRRTYAVGERDAVMMLPPETVCGSEARDFAWSADGTYLVAVRRVEDVRPADLKAWVSGAAKPKLRAQGRTELVVWGSQSRRARTVLTLAGPVHRLEMVGTMPLSDRVILDASETIAGANGAPDRQVESILMLSPASGTLTRLNVRDETSPTEVALSLSPNAPSGALVSMARGAHGNAVRFFGPSGVPGPVYPIAEGHYFAYDERGVPGFVTWNREGPKPLRQFQTIDPRSGALGPVVRQGRPAPEKEVTEPVQALAASVTLPKGFDAPTITLSLPGGKPEEAGVVTTDGEDPKVSPSFDAVAYVSQGSLVVRSFARVPRRAYEEALVARARSEAVAKAKQVGTALMIYTNDMDDRYPGKDADLRTLIGPYLKNDRLLDGFTYTFGGGSATDIDKPAETELGYVGGPGGRAVVYTDGHAKWVPNAP